MKIRPLYDRVLIEPVEVQTKTASGIIISATEKGKANEGKVLAVGNGRIDGAGKLIPVDIKVGDTVVFKKWSGAEVNLNGKELLIVKEEDILTVF